MPTGSVDVPTAWETTVKPALKPFVRALYSAGTFTRHDGSTWHFSVPNVAHGDKCEQHRADVEAALSAAVGSPVSIAIDVGGGVSTASDDDDPPAASGSKAPSDPTPSPADDDVDLDELTDAPPEAVLSPIDRLAQAFPGSELVEGAP